MQLKKQQTTIGVPMEPLEYEDDILHVLETPL